MTRAILALLLAAVFATMYASGFFQTNPNLVVGAWLAALLVALSPYVLGATGRITARLLIMSALEATLLLSVLLITAPAMVTDFVALLTIAFPAWLALFVGLIAVAIALPCRKLR